MTTPMSSYSNTGLRVSTAAAGCYTVVSATNRARDGQPFTVRKTFEVALPLVAGLGAIYAAVRR